MFYTSARTFHMIDWDLVGPRYMPDGLSRDTKRQYDILLNHLFTDSLRTQLMSHLSNDAVLALWVLYHHYDTNSYIEKWFEPIWWLTPCDCSDVHCMWLTFGDMSYTCSSHHVIIVVYTTCYCISLCEMNSKLDKGICWLFWPTESLSE